MLATVSPSLDDYPETMNTLKYAFRARAVKNATSLNKAVSVPANLTAEELTDLFGTEHPKLLETIMVRFAEKRHLITARNVAVRLPP